MTAKTIPYGGHDDAGRKEIRPAGTGGTSDTAGVRKSSP